MTQPIQLDVLALAAHPDDVELAIGGTMCLLARQGYRTGVVDFTRGELGSRGTPELRLEEAAVASRVMGLAARENLGFADGDIRNTKANQLEVIRMLRRYRPHILLINAPECRHPDHPAAARVATAAVFYAGLRKVETFDEGRAQEPWRPNHVLHYMQGLPFTPTFVVDVTEVWEERVQTLLAYRSQLHNPDYVPQEGEPETFISTPAFFQFIEAQARTYGYRIGATYGEPLMYRQGPVGIGNLMTALERDRPFK